MKRKNPMRILPLLLCVLLLLAGMAVPVSADTGPKASVRVRFENLGSELCYGTLLSEQASTGPASVWNGNEKEAKHKGNFDWAALDYETWKAFADYTDADGYYFLQESWQVSETKEIAWTYYPPRTFKVLLYWPETKSFAVSGVCERYAFDSYYTVNMEGVKIGSVLYDEEHSTDERLDAYRSYQYGQELLSLAARIVITILAEMAVALLFGFRRKKQLLILAAANVTTQLLLNLLLNLFHYKAGPFAFVAGYVLLELLIVAVEAVLYCTLLKKATEKPKANWYYVLYSFVANAVSFAAGMLIAHWLPEIF